MSEQHFRALEAMYAAAPINTIYQPELVVSEGKAVITQTVDPGHFHAAGALHGSVYFKLLDDAAFFAANALETEVFVLTTAYTTYITRPVSDGVVTAVGKVVNANRSQWIVEAVMEDEQGREIARGSGVFVRSKIRLRDTPGYKDVLA